MFGAFVIIVFYVGGIFIAMTHEQKREEEYAIAAEVGRKEHVVLHVSGNTISIQPDSGLVMNDGAPNKIMPLGDYFTVPTPHFKVPGAGKYTVRVYVCTKDKTQCFVDKHEIEVK